MIEREPESGRNSSIKCLIPREINQICMPIDTIIKVIAQTMHMDVDNIESGTRLDALGIDSLKAINIIFELEEIYDIEVPNEVISELETVQDIEDALQQLLNNK